MHPWWEQEDQNWEFVTFPEGHLHSYAGKRILKLLWKWWFKKEHADIGHQLAIHWDY